MINYVQMHKERRSTVENQVKNLSDFLKRVCLIPPQHLSRRHIIKQVLIRSPFQLYRNFMPRFKREFWSIYLSSKYQNVINVVCFFNIFEMLLQTIRGLDFKKLMGYETKENVIKIRCSGAGEWVVFKQKMTRGRLGINGNSLR